MAIPNGADTTTASAATFTLRARASASIGVSISPRRRMVSERPKAVRLEDRHALGREHGGLRYARLLSGQEPPPWGAIVYTISGWSAGDGLHATVTAFEARASLS